MAPEIIKNEKYSEKVDVWSYGVVLWELITRRVTFIFYILYFNFIFIFIFIFYFNFNFNFDFKTGSI